MVHAQLVHRLDTLSSRCLAKEEASVVRVHYVESAVLVCEDLLTAGLLETDSPCQWQEECFPLLQRLRQHIEDTRVRRHPELSVVLLDPEFGLTEDVCFFLAWALATRLALALGRLLELSVLDKSVEQILSDSDATHTVPAYIWKGKEIQSLTPVELEMAYASIFQHTRTISWDDKTLPRLTTALQVRAAQLLVERSYPQLAKSQSTEEPPELLMKWCERRVLWSCGSARLKLAQLHTLTWKAHAEHQLLSTLPALPGREVSTQDFNTYLQVTIKSWIGPRLRESLAKANNRRLLRPDEVGRNAAFEGNNRFCRARGGMDAMENALHSLDVVQLMACPEEQLVLASRSLKELLILRIVHNALESVTTCDLMGRHVVLQSLRDSCSSKGGTQVNLYVHKLLELPGGFVVTPHQPHYPNSPVSLEGALCLWYNTHFKGSDPLGVAEIAFLS